MHRTFSSYSCTQEAEVIEIQGMRETELIIDGLMVGGVHLQELERGL